MKYFFILILCLLPKGFYAQIHMDFSEKTSFYPVWQGDTLDFIIKNHELQSAGPEKSSILQLTTANQLCDSTSWRFKIKLDFIPSTTNYVRVYLMSDKNDLKTALNGYFIQLGQTGGETRLQFFKQEGTKTELLFTGQSILNSNNRILVHIKVSRSKDGEWQIFSNVQDKYNYMTEGDSFIETSFSETSTFGLYCRYSTASRYNMYTFDDIHIDFINTNDEELKNNEKPLNPGDIIINEIMFDPSANGSEYLELYNKSEDTITLNRVYLGIFDNEKKAYKTYSIWNNEDFQLYPKQYLLLSKDIDNIHNLYPLCENALYIEMSGMPTFPNQSGHIAIVDADTSLIDRFDYNSKMHHPLLVDTKGIALERINMDKPTQDMDNWYSASNSSGYGTPGCRNSQHLETNQSLNPFHIFPLVFSPDNDGIDDVLQINYNLESSGFTANIYIFDSHGNLVRHLIHNELLGTSGCFFWDGFSDKKTKLKTGIYIVIIDIFNMDGRIIRYKKPVTLIY